MPTNDERRDVAARLRNLAGHKAADEELTLDALGLYRGENIEGYDTYGVMQLADLIEPEPERICNAIDDFVLPGQVQTYPYKICSNCHSDFPRLACNGEVSVENYCPNCGARVVK